MTVVAVKKTEGRMARPLKVLVPLIQEELQAGQSAGLEHYRRAGEMLLEVRESGQVAAFKWGTWLSKNFELSRSTAWRYMRLAEQERGAPDVPRRGTTVRSQDGTTDNAQAAWRTVAAAAREVNRELFGQDRQTRSDEVQLHRDIALELIDLGYRALALRLHPDKGGSKDAMRRLNRVRDELKSLASTRRFYE